MATYLVQASYTPEALKALIQNPQNRSEVARKLAEGLGGKMIGYWLAFGDYDFAAICEVPDHTSALAASMVIGASGSFRNVKTTPLVALEDGVEAMKKAATVAYKAVVAKE
ncbi:MAG TPA: GYD domain-containing protein [Terracidiphilus sp.]